MSKMHYRWNIFMLRLTSSISKEHGDMEDEKSGVRVGGSTRSFNVQNSFSQWGFRIASRHVPDRPPFFHKRIFGKDEPPTLTIHSLWVHFCQHNQIMVLPGIANHDFLAQLPSHLSLQSVRPAKKYTVAASLDWVWLAFQ